MSMSLTTVQARCLLLIETSIEQTGTAPSYREIMTALDLKSLSGVHRIVHGLKKRERIRTRIAAWRSIEVIRPLEASEYKSALEGVRLSVALREMADRLDARESEVAS